MKTIISFFEQSVEDHSNKIAFIDALRHSTFSETMFNSQSIGSALLPYGKQRPIAVMIDKSCNCIDSMLGALFANDFYVVMDVKLIISRQGKQVYAPRKAPIRFKESSNPQRGKQLYAIGKHLRNSTRKAVLRFRTGGKTQPPPQAACP